MRARFVRTPNKADRVYVTRSDGSETHWSFPSYGDGLPHDLVHLAIEIVFELRGGFWGRVDGGAEVEQINALANRKGGKDKYAAFGPELEELLLAEALAGASWWVEGVSDEDRRRTIVDATGVDAARLPLDRFARAHVLLAELGVRWTAIAPKGSVDLEADLGSIALT